MKIADKIHQVDNVKGANCYLVETAEGLLLVDTGLAGSDVPILQYIEGIDRKPEAVKYIVLTHYDLDHTGSAATLKAKTGAKLAIHQDDADILAGKQPPRKLGGFWGFAFRLFSKFMKSTPVEADILLKDGDRIGNLLVIHNPGHTRGSISLWDQESRALFSGDTLLSDREGNIRMPRADFAGDIQQANQSAEKLKALDFKILLPGHGTPRIGRANPQATT